MNEANYASLEASKRLVAAGIVLETDFYKHLSIRDMDEIWDGIKDKQDYKEVGE